MTNKILKKNGLLQGTGRIHGTLLPPTYEVGGGDQTMLLLPFRTWLLFWKTVKLNVRHLKLIFNFQF